MTLFAAQSWFELNDALSQCKNQGVRTQFIADQKLLCLGLGCHKSVFALDSDWVLKVGSLAAICRDRAVWEKVHPSNQMYYATTVFDRYLEIQERGQRVTFSNVPDCAIIAESDIRHLRSVARDDGIWDIRPDNIVQCADGLKIIDGRPRL